MKIKPLSNNYESILPIDYYHWEEKLLPSQSFEKAKKKNTTLKDKSNKHSSKPISKLLNPNEL